MNAADLYRLSAWMLGADGNPDHKRAFTVIERVMLRTVAASPCDCPTCAAVKKIAESRRLSAAAASEVKQEWHRRVEEAIRSAADWHNTFTTDDVWAFLYEQDVTPPVDARGIGGIMKRMQSAGVIEKADTVVASDGTATICWRKKEAS